MKRIFTSLALVAIMVATCFAAPPTAPKAAQGPDIEFVAQDVQLAGSEAITLNAGCPGCDQSYSTLNASDAGCPGCDQSYPVNSATALPPRYAIALAAFLVLMASLVYRHSLHNPQTRQ